MKQIYYIHLISDLWILKCRLQAYRIYDIDWCADLQSEWSAVDIRSHEFANDNSAQQKKGIVSNTLVTAKGHREAPS